MKTLVVYYSLTGNTEFVARTIAQSLGAELLKLQPRDDIPASGFMKYVRGGKQVMQKIKPELLPLDKNVQEYEMIFVGTPVWAGSYAPALATFFETVQFKGKKVALFCCHGGGKGRALEKMRTRLLGNVIVGEIDFREPLKQKTEHTAEQIRGWAQEMVSD